MGFTERPRSLNPSKAKAMAISPIIVHFSPWRARSMHDVACRFARAAVRSKDAQKQLARTSLNLALFSTILPDTSPRLNRKPALDKRSILIRHVTWTSYKLEPAICSRGTGQRITKFDNCQFPST